MRLQAIQDSQQAILNLCKYNWVYMFTCTFCLHVFRQLLESKVLMIEAKQQVILASFPGRTWERGYKQYKITNKHLSLDLQQLNSICHTASAEWVATNHPTCIHCATPTISIYVSVTSATLALSTTSNE